MEQPLEGLEQGSGFFGEDAGCMGPLHSQRFSVGAPHPQEHDWNRGATASRTPSADPERVSRKSATQRRIKRKGATFSYLKYQPTPGSFRQAINNLHKTQVAAALFLLQQLYLWLLR